MLEHAVENSSKLAKFFGITTVIDPSTLSATYPFNLTQIALRMKKGANWAYAHRLIDQVTAGKGFNLNESDNKYHRAEKYGKTVLHNDSEATCTVLSAARDGTTYSV